MPVRFLTHAKVLMEINQSRKQEEYLPFRGTNKLGVLPVIGHFASQVCYKLQKLSGRKMQFKEGEYHELLQMVMASRVCGFYQ